LHLLHIRYGNADNSQSLVKRHPLSERGHDTSRPTLSRANPDGLTPRHDTDFRVTQNSLIPVLAAVSLLLTAAVGCSRGCAENAQDASGKFTELPTDAELLGIFYKHRDEFIRLRQMASEDAVQQGYYFTTASLRAGLPASRRREYQGLFSRIDPRLVVRVDYDGIVRFIVGATGSSAIGPGKLKGIEFVPDGARSGANEQDSLDDATKLGEGVYQRGIERNWYLLFQRVD
jgi:hypothetical protein